jgi:thiamine-phosphate pyrophosphorylase
MMLHLVTDRRRLTRHGDEQARTAAVVEQTRLAIDAGIDVIQIREPDLSARRLLVLARALVQASRGSATRIVLNDRLDVALLAHADGVHLRGDSFSAEAVRRLAPAGFLIGRSVRRADEALAAGPVDYLIAGTIWPTSSKPPEHALIGVGGLRAIAAAVTVPVLAIGGVEPANARLTCDAGAAGVAAIGAFMAGSTSGENRVMPLVDVVRTFRRACQPDKMNG